MPVVPSPALLIEVQCFPVKGWSLLRKAALSWRGVLPQCRYKRLHTAWGDDHCPAYPLKGGVLLCLNPCSELPAALCWSQREEMLLQLSWRNRC